MTERKFYKTTITFEVLSEEPIGSVSLSDLEYMTTEGHCSGQFKDTIEQVLNGKEMADALTEQGSDTEFFELDEDGNDEYEYEPEIGDLY